MEIASYNSWYIIFLGIFKVPSSCSQVFLPVFIPLYSPALSHLRQWLSKDSWCHQPSARSCNGNGFGFGSGSGQVFSARFSFELVAKIVSGFEINVACVGGLFSAVHSIPEIAGWDCRSKGGLLGVAYMYIWPSVIRQLTFVYYPCGGHIMIRGGSKFIRFLGE